MQQALRSTQLLTARNRQLNVVIPASPAAETLTRRDSRAELRGRAAALAAGIVSPKYLAEVRTVRAELLWVSGQLDLARQAAREAYEQAPGQADPG